MPNEDDLLRLTLNVQEEKSATANPYRLFGIVVKKMQLRIEDSSISNATREYIKQKTKPDSATIGTDVNYSVMEIHVHTKFRKYQISPDASVDYEVIFTCIILGYD